MPPLCRFSAPSQPTSTALGRLQPHCYTHLPSASQQGFASTLTPAVPRVPCTSFIAPPARLPRNRACLLLLLRRCRGFLGDSLRRVRQLEIHFEGRLRALLLQQRKLARPQSIFGQRLISEKNPNFELKNPPIYYSTRSGSENEGNEFFQIGSKQIKTGPVSWSKKIKSETHFEAITTTPLCISALVLFIYSVF